MSSSIRVRFAPSPTGSLQLGNVRTALFDWLMARHEQGVFVLRFEDTDRERLVPEAAEQIEASLKWLGLDWDEGVDVGGEYGPYIQSERLKIYHEHAKKLEEQGSLYPCWCTPERLEGLRQQAQAKHMPFTYDRYCLDHPGDKIQPHVLRFKTRGWGLIKWNDLIKGPVEFSAEDLDDFVAIKSDGFPTYHFASVVDDHLMHITHVIRGDEWISSTPKHLLLYQASGWTPPALAHVPAVLDTSKAKLSKRRGAKSVLEYRDRGYLPEALVNFLALLGWNDGSEQEIYSRDELIAAFTIERVQKSPAVFDPERLNWMNGVYIRTLSLEELDKRCDSFWSAAARNSQLFTDTKYRLAVLGLVQERLKFLAELPELTEFFFDDPQLDADELFAATKHAAGYLEQTLKTLKDTQFNHDQLEHQLRPLVSELNTKPSQLFGLIRVAITGQTAAPGLFETMAVLGQEAVLRRLQRAQALLTK